MAAAVNDDQQLRSVVVAILVPNSKQGMQLKQIEAEYLEQEGKPLMPSQQETYNYLRSLVDIGAILLINGYYFANTKNSKHVIDLVKNQNEDNKKKRNLSHFNNGASRGKYSGGNQPSYSNAIPNRRQSVCYEKPYIDVYKPPPVAARLQKRRMTIGPQFRPDTPPRSRSRSNSPKKNGTVGRNYNHNEKRSHSPDLRKRPRDHSPRSPAAKRSRCYRSRSRSPSRDHKQSRPRTHSRSPPRDPRRRSRSPNESKRRRYSPTRERTNVNGSVHENTPPVRPVQAVTPQDTNQKAIFERLSGVTVAPGPSMNVRYFKFNIIGDGLLYNVVRGLDENVALNPFLISEDLPLKTAIDSVKAIVTPKVHKKKCVILSIGTTDLQKGTCLSDMRKQFFTLYQLCQHNGLKPLVTTVSCMDTKELIAKAGLFNEFLRNNFTNVIDLFKAVNGSNGGLAQTLANIGIGSKYVLNRANLSIGMHSRLVLRVDVKSE